MKQLYDSLHALHNIQALIDNAERESEVLEYKGAVTQFSNGEKIQISKDVSAMANASGGIIIFGIRTNTIRLSQSRYKEFTSQTLRHLIG